MPSGPDGSSLGSGPWENVLTDVRGPFTVALFQNDGAYASCFTGSSFTETNMVSLRRFTRDGTVGLARGSASLGGSTAAGSGGGPGRAPEACPACRGGGDGLGRSDTRDAEPPVDASDGPYTLVDGRAATGVTGVTLVLDDGQDIVTTVADGWFVAWWPDTASATSAQVTTASGTTTESLLWPQHGPSGPPVPGTSGATGNSGSSVSSGSTGSSGNSGNS